MDSYPVDTWVGYTTARLFCSCPSPCLYLPPVQANFTPLPSWVAQFCLPPHRPFHYLCRFYLPAATCLCAFAASALLAGSCAATAVRLPHCPAACCPHCHLPFTCLFTCTTLPAHAITLLPYITLPLACLYIHQTPALPRPPGCSCACFSNRCDSYLPATCLACCCEPLPRVDTAVYKTPVGFTRTTRGAPHSVLACAMAGLPNTPPLARQPACSTLGRYITLLPTFILTLVIDYWFHHLGSSRAAYVLLD